MADIPSRLKPLLREHVEKQKERLQKAEEYYVVVKENEALDKEIRELQRQYASYSNERSIICSLPVNILALIFEYACIRPNWNLQPVLSNQPMEIRLCQVSRFWRDFAIQCPKLWTTFLSRGHHPSEKRRFSLYLKRSCNRLLDLKFEGDSPTMAEMLELAAENAMRWRNFFLKLNHALYLTVFYRTLVSKCIPHLHFLELHVMTTAHEGMLFEGGAPKISCLYMDPWTLSNSLPSFKYVTGINIQRGKQQDEKDFAQFLDLMRQENLENLSILGNVFGPPFSNLVSMTPICAPNLKFLRCGDVHVQTNLWNLVRAPRLEVLIFMSPTMGTSTWQHVFPMDNMYDMMAPHLYPSLYTVALMDSNTSPISFKSLQKFAYATKNAKRLYTSDRICMDRTGVFFSMVKNSDSTLLWPELEEIYCTTRLNRKPDGNDFMQYLDVVKLRSQELSKHCKLFLPKCEAEHWKSESPETWRQLEEGGFYEEIPMNRDGSPKHGLDVIPWPPRDGKYSDVKDLNLYERQCLSYKVT